MATDAQISPDPPGQAQAAAGPEAGAALAGTPVVCSWSGGKDAALALHEAVRAGARPRLLVTMLTEDGVRSRSHGLHRAVLEAQAAAMGLPIHFASATWSDYERGFATLMAQADAAGARAGIFGDIDIEGHRAWVTRLAATAGLSAHLPLWHRERAAVVRDLTAAGFRAILVAVREGMLDPSLLGRTIDAALLDELAHAGVDLAGEEGEYHSLVLDGPLFARPLDVVLGERVLRDGVWFVDVRVGA